LVNVNVLDCGHIHRANAQTREPRYQPHKELPLIFTDSQNHSTPTQASTSTVPVTQHKATASTVSTASLLHNGTPPTPSAADRQPSPVPPPAMARKFNSPFSWLSRATTVNDKKPQSPPPIISPVYTGERRNTVSSINSELMINKFSHDGDEASSNTGNNRGSLKDRFKLLRMREEAGISSFSEEPFADGSAHGSVFAGLVGRSASMGMGVASPTTALSPDEEKNEAQTMPSRQGSTAGVSPGTRQATINLNLAPGTASGIAAGPGGDSNAPVDWDLWQAVVYEGPAAVARTSPEELNSAIANGIPQAIRGVVWQVLAKSKNEDLETIYHELVIRGTDKEKLTANGHTSLVSNGSNDKESIASSASSIRSQHSTPATTAGAVSPQPSSNGDQADDVTKLQNGLHAVKGTSSKEEAAKIQKLEKVIKRDLGARTSYSKYVMAAGLQDGLFGVCKAYALYDEAVGYAQGMNFIAMPLLFNVSWEMPRPNYQVANPLLRCLKKRRSVCSSG
jgi:hypothetical protein